MSKALTQVLIASLLPAVLFPTRAAAQPDLPDPIRIRHSKPITHNNATFAIVAETDWSTGKDRRDVPLEVHLQIENKAKEAKTFPTFDSIYLIMTTAAGKKIFAEGGRNATIFTRPILIPPSATFSLVRKAELHWDEKAKAHVFSYSDGTGSIMTFGPLTPGEYDVSFLISAPPPQEKGLGLKKIQGESKWRGEVFTGSVRVRVTNP